MRKLSARKDTQEMGKINYQKTTIITDGLYLKKSESGVYHYYFRLSGIEFRKSTKTKDKLTATKIAMADFDHAVHKKEKGLDIRTLSFKQASQHYLLSFKNESRNKYHTDTIKRHILPFFSKFDDISKIRMTDLDDYKQYRLQKNPDVTPQTLNRENTVLNMLLKFAEEREWIKYNLRAKSLSEKMTRRRRGHFSLEEYKQLIATSKKRISEFRPKNLKGQSKGLYVNKFHQRQLLHDVMLILSNTGMRVDELKHVRWRDIDFDTGQIKFHGIGKVNSHRHLNVRDSGIVALKRLQERRLSYLNKNNEKLDPNEFIQSLPNGTFVKSFKKGFNDLLSEAGFQYSDGQDKHTLTSLRHFFATIRMTTKTGKRASVQALAKQMGTSVKMIEKHYGHDTAIDYADEILG